MKRYKIFNDVVFSDTLTKTDLDMISLCNLGQGALTHRIYKNPELAELVSAHPKINQIFQKRLQSHQSFIQAGKYVPDTEPSQEEKDAEKARLDEIERLLMEADAFREKEEKRKRKEQREQAKLQADKAFGK